jgi:hypothetical protein
MAKAVAAGSLMAEALKTGSVTVVVFTGKEKRFHSNDDELASILL